MYLYITVHLEIALVVNDTFDFIKKKGIRLVEQFFCLDHTYNILLLVIQHMLQM